jgi:hypothetical protein
MDSTCERAIAPAGNSAGTGDAVTVGRLVASLIAVGLLVDTAVGGTEVDVQETSRKAPNKAARYFFMPFFLPFIEV